MAFETGTVTDYRDLLDKLKIFLDGEGWTINDFNLGAALTDVSNLNVTGPGISGGQKPNISIQTDDNSGTNAYAWKVCGHQTYVSGRGFGLQPNNGPIHYFLLWPNTMTYWFYANDRRFIVVAKIGVYYMSMYAGFFLPYALPDEYPYPYFVGATSNQLLVYNTPDAGIRTFCDPGPGAASYMARQTLGWESIQNANFSANVVDSYSGAGNEGAVVWPFRNLQVENDFQANRDIAWSMFRLMRPLLNGVMPMYQLHILDAANETLAGVLDGVHVTGGFNRVPEQIVEVDAQDYRLFINVNRNTPKHYFAVEEA